MTFSFTQSEVASKTVAFAKSDATYGQYLAGWALHLGPVGEARFKAQLSDIVDAALLKGWPGDDAKQIRATRKAWIKANLIGRSNGIAGPVGVEAYYKATSDALIAKGLKKASNAGANRGANTSPKGAKTVPDQKAQTAKGREHLAMTLTGNAQFAALLLKSLETAERDQTLKYLVDRFGN